MTYEYDDAAVLCFLENQRQLFPEDVAENESEAEAFLEDCMAVIADSARRYWSILRSRASIRRKRMRRVFWKPRKFLRLETDATSLWKDKK